MGEAKRRKQIEEAVNAVTKDLVDKGELIEAGFQSMVIVSYNGEALPQDQFNELRNAFFAGAQHLFGTIMNILDPGEEPTDADLKRMDLIDNELRRFIVDFEERHGLRAKPHPTAQ